MRSVPPVIVYGIEVFNRDGRTYMWVVVLSNLTLPILTSFGEHFYLSCGGRGHCNTIPYFN